MSWRLLQGWSADGYLISLGREPAPVVRGAALKLRPAGQSDPQLLPARHVQLAVDRGEVRLDRFDADVQVLGDPPVGAATHGPVRDRALAVGQRLDTADPGPP